MPTRILIASLLTGTHDLLFKLWKDKGKVCTALHDVTVN
jgi:hypothetical protein